MYTFPPVGSVEDEMHLIVWKWLLQADSNGASNSWGQCGRYSLALSSGPLRWLFLSTKSYPKLTMISCATRRCTWAFSWLRPLSRGRQTALSLAMSRRICAGASRSCRCLPVGSPCGRQKRTPPAATRWGTYRAANPQRWAVLRIGGSRTVFTSGFLPITCNRVMNFRFREAHAESLRSAVTSLPWGNRK